MAPHPAHLARHGLASMTDEVDSYPLQGIRVVAVEQAIAVPLATRHLADLGAEVIKIERPPGGDFARTYDSLADGVSVHFAWTNRGKKSVVLDLKSEEGLADAMRLVSTADVFVHNLGPGVIERLGLGWEAVSARSPGLIACELSGYGDGGPMAGRKAYDLLIQSEIGAASVSGEESAPAKIGISVVDISGAMYVLSSILAAIIQRKQDGKGRRLQVTLFDAIAEWMSVPLLQAKHQGTFYRSGRYHNSIFPYGPFACADGEVVVAIQNDAEWGRFCSGVLGRPELTSDARYAHTEGRHANRAQLGRLIESAFGVLSRAELCARLAAADVPFAESRSVEEAAVHPELVERGRWATFVTERGEVELLRSPFDSDTGWPTPPGGVPRLGQDNGLV